MTTYAIIRYLGIELATNLPNVNIPNNANYTTPKVWTNLTAKNNCMCYKQAFKIISDFLKKKSCNGINSRLYTSKRIESNTGSNFMIDRHKCQLISTSFYCVQQNSITSLVRLVK